MLMADLAPSYDTFLWGLQARIARILHVSESTISRDVKAVLRPDPARTCPTCGARKLSAEELERMDAIIEEFVSEDVPERDVGTPLTEQAGSSASIETGR